MNHSAIDADSKWLFWFWVCGEVSIASSSTLSVEKDYGDIPGLNTKNTYIYIFVGGTDAFMPGPVPSSGMQEMYPRGPQGMGMRPQYPYGQGFDRRSVIFHSKLHWTTCLIWDQLHVFCNASSSGLTMPWAQMVEWCLLEIRTTWCLPTAIQTCTQAIDTRHIRGKDY